MHAELSRADEIQFLTTARSTDAPRIAMELQRWHVRQWKVSRRQWLPCL